MALEPAVNSLLVGLAGGFAGVAGTVAIGFLGFWISERDDKQELQEENRQLKRLEVLEAADSPAASPASVPTQGTPMISIVTTTTINNYYGDAGVPDADHHARDTQCQALWDRIHEDRETRSRQTGEDDFTRWLDAELARRERQYDRACEK